MVSETNLNERIQGVSGRALNAAVLLYTRWEEERERSPLDRVVSGFFRSRRDLNSGERRWISEAVYGSVRFLRRLTFLIVHHGLPDTPENRIRLWADIVSTDSALPQPNDPHNYLRVTLSFPDPLADELETLLGLEAPAAGEAFNLQAPTTLRVNPLKANRRQVLAALPDSAPTLVSPWGVTLAHRANVYDLPGFREGWYEVQEEASQLVALLTDVQPGQVVVEVGAGAGGKSLALAALMQNQGRIFAVDTSASRLEELVKRAARAGVSCIEPCLVETDDTGQWQPVGKAKRTLNRLFQSADCVLVDAPCTGSGILRRSPDAKWRSFDIEAITQLQQVLLAQAASLVKPGGSLVYATCAFERSQNEDIITAFLASDISPIFHIDPLDTLASSALSYDRKGSSEKSRRDQVQTERTGEPEVGESLFTPGIPYLRTWPHRQRLDAFFVARLRRQPASLLAEKAKREEEAIEREGD